MQFTGHRFKLFGFQYVPPRYCYSSFNGMINIFQSNKVESGISPSLPLLLFRMDPVVSGFSTDYFFLKENVLLETSISDHRPVKIFTSIRCTVR